MKKLFILLMVVAAAVELFLPKMYQEPKEDEGTVNVVVSETIDDDLQEFNCIASSEVVPPIVIFPEDIPVPIACVSALPLYDIGLSVYGTKTMLIEGFECFY